MKLKAGDQVEVRSKSEILRTVDKNGQLDGLPFMPEMFKYCGRRFTVFKRAHKTCGFINDAYVGRGLSNAIHLNLRCDGTAHGRCQANCLIFWKEAWLKRPGEELHRHEGSHDGVSAPSTPMPESQCTEEDVLHAATKIVAGEENLYVCQMTQLPEFTTPLKWWDARQYIEDYQSNNTTLGRILRALIHTTYYHGTLAYKPRLGRPARWLYDMFQAAWGGVPFPRRKGTIMAGQSTPRSDLNLQPGELVRVKSYKDILSTVDEVGSNRGLMFDAEMVPYCEQTFRVRARVERFVDDNTGKMRSLKTPAVILDNAYCKSLYSESRMLCPRGIYSWWREIWLERVPESSPVQGRPGAKISGVGCEFERT